MTTPRPPRRPARRPLAPRVATPREPVDPARIGRRVVRRRAKGMDAGAVAAALEDARFDVRQNSRHEDLVDDARGRAALAEWERIDQLLVAAPSGTVYVPDTDVVVPRCGIWGRGAAEADDRAAVVCVRRLPVGRPEGRGGGGTTRECSGNRAEPMARLPVSAGAAAGLPDAGGPRPVDRRVGERLRRPGITPAGLPRLGRGRLGGKPSARMLWEHRCTRLRPAGPADHSRGHSAEAVGRRQAAPN
ncbi:hypothetical protein [Streptomyces sp. SCL15-4]|uniref:hypothetical protein n=1 Tax=Streptomyces sp. SCL15-4 TaxID=2967221 RepID=UPI002966168F|nr:hypothetical protein [Streptomyces sp. SCL15-4]